jgi:hypothetical protein
MLNPTRNPGLLRARLNLLRPTQMSVGYAEVQLKHAQWRAMKRRERESELAQHVFPSVLGPEKSHYIIDHHHLGIALIEAGVREVWLIELDDLSWLEPPVFWRTMEFRSWTHPFDRRGRRRSYEDMPASLTKLKDDPYRSLAGMVRRAGGYAKEQTVFAEFLWADFFRPQIEAELIDQQPRRAVREGVKLAQSSTARYLPGWSGKAPVGTTAARGFPT